MRNSTKYCVLLLFLLFILTFFNQVHAQKSNFSSQHFGVNQSMSSSTIGSIYQGRIGYLWFLTDQGLDRFDGYNFITYKYSINSKVIRLFMPGTIVEDREGNIWVGFINGGIEKFNPETQTFKNFLTDPEHPVTELGNRVLNVRNCFSSSLAFLLLILSNRTFFLTYISENQNCYANQY